MSTQHRTWTAVAVLGLAAAGVVAAAAYAEDVEIKDDSGFAWIDGNDDVPAIVTRESVKKGIPRGGHPIDIIPPIDEPRWYASHEAAAKDLGLLGSDRVLGVVVGEDARAYPTRILDRHEIVNDTVGGKPLAVVW